MPVFFFHFIACFHKAPALVSLYFCWYLSAEKTKINTKISLLAIGIENIVLCYVRWLRCISQQAGMEFIHVQALLRLAST